MHRIAECESNRGRGGERDHWHNTDAVLPTRTASQNELSYKSRTRGWLLVDRLLGLPGHRGIVRWLWHLLGYAIVIHRISGFTATKPLRQRTSPEVQPGAASWCAQPDLR